MVRFIYIISILILIALIGYFTFPFFKHYFTPPTDTSQIGANDTTFRANHGLSGPISYVRIVITKSNRMLYLLSGDNLIESWKIALGRNPAGSKTASNDGKTPVGDYSICDRKSNTDYHLYLQINYPSRHDADIALRDGIIVDRTHQEIYKSVTENRTPPQDTPLGGEVGLTGGGTSRDWTDGNIALDDAAIEILWAECPDGTSVTIYEEFTDWNLASMMPSAK
jgi:hypothetical protein